MVRTMINIITHEVKERNTCEDDEQSDDGGIIPPG